MAQEDKELREFLDDEDMKKVVEQFQEEMKEIKKDYDDECFRLKKLCIEAIQYHIGVLYSLNDDEDFDERFEKSRQDLEQRKKEIRKRATSNIDTFLEKVENISIATMIDIINAELCKNEVDTEN